MPEILTPSILSGISVSPNIGAKNQYGFSLGIDPLMPGKNDGVHASALIRPTQMVAMSSGADDVPLFLISNPKNTKCYAILANGKCKVINNNLGMDSPITTPSASSGNGAAYYDNYIHFRKNTDVARFGPLNGSPSLVQSFWQTTLGLTALRNQLYPLIGGVRLPNGYMHRHTDNALYFCDVLTSNFGALHKIKTKKTTVEGDTDDGSDHNNLDLPYGWWPVTICSFGTYLLISFIEGASTTIMQKPARLILYDTVSDSFDDVTIDKNFSEPLITALQPTRDGSVMIFSGKPGGGCRIDRFASLNAVSPVTYLADVYPPLQGAVDSYGDRVSFGSKCTIPTSAACIYSLGSYVPEFGDIGLHVTGKCTASGANPQATCLKYFKQSASKPFPIVGHKSDGSLYDIDKLTDTINTSILVKISVDGEDYTTIYTIQKSTDEGKKNIVINPSTIAGKHDFRLQLKFSNGMIFRDRLINYGAPFTLDKIRILMNEAVSASGVMAVKLPIAYYPLPVKD